MTSPLDVHTRSDEPSVRNVRLRALVDAARSVGLPALRVDARAVHAGWQQRRAQQRWRLAGLAGILVAVVVLSTMAVRLDTDLLTGRCSRCSAGAGTTWNPDALCGPMRR
jgi:hypothetical protein